MTKDQHKELVKDLCEYITENALKFNFLEYDDLTEDCRYYVVIKKQRIPSENRFILDKFKDAEKEDAPANCAECFWFAVCYASYRDDDSGRYRPTIGCPIYRVNFESLHYMLERLEEKVIKEMSYEQSNRNNDNSTTVNPDRDRQTE